MSVTCLDAQSQPRMRQGFGKVSDFALTVAGGNLFGEQWFLSLIVLASNAAN